MSEFFQSEIVRQTILELEELQEKIIQGTMNSLFMDSEQKKEHFSTMKIFLEKQKNLYFRLSLSDDPEAVEMKERVNYAASFLGKREDQTVFDFFNDLERQLNSLEENYT